MLCQLRFRENGRFRGKNAGLKRHLTYDPQGCGGCLGHRRPYL
jgi:hypothetical protein